jgi:hypothetical protein
MFERDKAEVRRLTEIEAARLAKETGRSMSYIDDDGCEITVTPEGACTCNSTPINTATIAIHRAPKK